MSQRSKDDILSDLAVELAERLLEKVRNGESVTAAELNVARQYLKDNEIQSPRGSNPPLDELREKMLLPKFDDDQLPA